MLNPAPEETNPVPAPESLHPQAKYPELNHDNLKLAFAAFADKQKISLVSLIKLLIPAHSGKQVVVTLSKQQEELIGEIKIDWQAFLKSYFNDYDITLVYNIDDNAGTVRKAYTPSEQFEEMLAGHDLFRQMVNRFKLKLKQ